MISLVNWAWLRKNYSELEDMTIETQKLKKRLKKEPKTEYPCRKKTGEKKQNRIAKNGGTTTKDVAYV